VPARAARRSGQRAGGEDREDARARSHGGSGRRREAGGECEDTANRRRYPAESAYSPVCASPTRLGADSGRLNSGHRQASADAAIPRHGDGIPVHQLHAPSSASSPARRPESRTCARVAAAIGDVHDPVVSVMNVGTATLAAAGISPLVQWWAAGPSDLDGGLPRVGDAYRSLRPCTCRR